MIRKSKHCYGSLGLKTDLSQWYNGKDYLEIEGETTFSIPLSTNERTVVNKQVWNTLTGPSMVLGASNSIRMQSVINKI